MSRGAELLVRTLLASGVDTCFANPGTSEMHFVSALDRHPAMRCVLGLAETVVTGCADGYARMAGRPAATLLHCGPGLANGVANLHNARRAGTPMVNIVGDHATWHLVHDAPLTMDIDAIAGTVSKWVGRPVGAGEVSRLAATAVREACSPATGVATLVLPADCAWDEVADERVVTLPPRPAAAPSPQALDDAVRALADGGSAALLLSGAGLQPRGLEAAARIAAATGARLLAPTQVPRIARGRGRPAVDRIPYAVAAALAALADLRHLVLCGAAAPVAFFAYPGKPSAIAPPGCTIHLLAGAGDDVVGALELLADRLPARAPQARPAPTSTALPGGPITPAGCAAYIARLLPEQAIVVEDAVTSGRAMFPPTFDAAPHDWIQVTGGAIGHGLPAAAGAAVACPDRKVVCLQSDGGGMYSLQALWTQARERLDVVTIVFANRAYAILRDELAAVGAEPGAASRDLFDIGRPTLDWVAMAGGMGVDGARVTSLEGFADVMGAALRRRGPFLIEAVLP